MVKMGYVNGLLINEQQERPPVCFISVCHRPRNGLIVFVTKQGVICLYKNRSIIILENVGMLT